MSFGKLFCLAVRVKQRAAKRIQRQYFSLVFVDVICLVNPLMCQRQCVLFRNGRSFSDE